MATDNDLSALMPQPPPPRLARRKAAIEHALRRFDGDEQGDVPAATRPAPRFEGWGRPQIAALASVALVVLVSVPVWWAEKDRLVPAGPQVPVPIARNSPEPVPASTKQASQVQAADPRSAQALEAVPPSPVAEAGQPLAPEAMESNLNRLPQFVPAQTRSSAAASAGAPATNETNTSRLPAAPPRIAPALRAAAPPPPAAQTARQAGAEAGIEQGDRSIVVTGSRVQRDEFNSNTPIAAVADLAQPGGEWNACTLHDPRRNPAVCGSSAGRSAAQLDEGLTLAWRGDLDRAIDAFGRAIAANPDLALAYLNRGLVWQSKGDLGRALADLNRAIARDPSSAAAYYHRSLIHRARGDGARADADARKATEIDPR
jgi:tetratricopeptide (TPR) repeat protein